MSIETGRWSRRGSGVFQQRSVFGHVGIQRERERERHVVQHCAHSVAAAQQSMAAIDP